MNRPRSGFKSDLESVGSSIGGWTRRLALPISLRIQKALQDQHRRHLVHQRLMFLPALARGIENLMRLPASQPLIPEMHRQTCQQTQLLRKGPRLPSLRTRLAGEMQRIAHHDPHAPKPPAKPCQRPQILAWIPLPGQSQHWLRQQPKLIRNSHTNPLRPNVETEVTGNG